MKLARNRVEMLQITSACTRQVGATAGTQYGVQPRLPDDDVVGAREGATRLVTVAFATLVKRCRHVGKTGILLHVTRRVCTDRCRSGTLRCRPSAFVCLSHFSLLLLHRQYDCTFTDHQAAHEGHVCQNSPLPPVSLTTDNASPADHRNACRAQLVTRLAQHMHVWISAGNETTSASDPLLVY
jgi:hypothetical protein